MEYGLGRPYTLKTKTQHFLSCGRTSKMGQTILEAAATSALRAKPKGTTSTGLTFNGIILPNDAPFPQRSRLIIRARTFSRSP